MADLFQPNDGDRPSALDLGRMATGETDRVEGPELAAFEAEVSAARDALPTFDFEVLQSASHRVADDRPSMDVFDGGSERIVWWRSWILIPLLSVALLFFMTITPPNALENRIKGPGDTDLSYYLLRRGRILPGVEKAPLKPGDKVQFTYRADVYETMVLINVDGNGEYTVFYPESGQEPVEVLPGSRHVLDGSILLDGAPGPETFVAVFNPGSVERAMALVQATYEAGGHPALETLEDTDPAVAIVVIDKKRME
jgi:hypothetical protein